MSEIQVLDRGMLFDGNALRAMWFRIRDREGNVRFRAVALRELAYLPIEARNDPDVLGKQWAALRGLYNAGVDFSYTAMGVYRPRRVGVVQFYGAAAEEEFQDAAVGAALRRMAAVEAVLANYPQSRLRAPDTERVQWLMERLERLPRVLAVLGHPDPRLARKGLGRDGSMGEADDELMSQQGETFLRGLAALEEDFVFAVMAAHVARGDLAKGLVKLSQTASIFASRQRGNVGASFSIAIPLAAALAGNYGGSHGRGDSHAVSHADGTSETWGEHEAHSTAHTTTHAVTESEAHTVGHAVTDSWGHTTSHAETESTAKTTSWAHATGGAETHSRADTVSEAHTTGGAHTTSHSTSVSHSSGSTWAKSVSDGTAHTTSHSAGSTWSHAVSDGTAHTESHATGTSQGSGTNWSRGGGTTISSSTTHGTSEVNSTAVGTTWGTTTGESHATSQSDMLGGAVASSRATSTTNSQSHTSSWGWSASDTVGGKVGGSIGIISGSLSNSITASVHGGSADTTGSAQTMTSGTTTTDTHAHTTGTTDTTSFSTSHGGSLTTGHAEGTTSAHTSGKADSTTWSTGGSSFAGTSRTDGVANTTSHVVTNSRGGFTSHGTADTTSHVETTSRGGFNSTTRGEAWGTATTRSWAHTKGTAHTEGIATSKTWTDVRGGATSRGHATTDGWAVTRGHAVTESESWTTGRAETRGEAWTEGETRGTSHMRGVSHVEGAATAYSLARSATRGFVGGFGGSIVPGFAVTRSWQTEDDVAIRLTELTRMLESLLNQASAEGGFLTTAVLLTTDRGATAAAALVPQAFHGPNVPTPVLTVDGPDDLRVHALTMRPSLEPDGDPFDAGLWTKWGTLLTPGMLAAYTAPNLFEEGTAVTVQERIPPMAFYPETEGEVVIGHQVSPETGRLTTTPLRLSRSRHFHTAFIGDTGYGKSVAAERIAYETTLHWKMKTIILDFGAGWRKMLNAPGLEGHVDIRQLSPGGPRPLRWNPLQIGRNILPEVQWRAFADIFGNVAKLGERRQIHELREALRQVYLTAGVLVDDPEVQEDGHWGRVRDAEEARVTGEAVGTALRDLSRAARQRLAVYRSQFVGFADLYAYIEAEIRHIPPRDIRRSILEGILYRLHPLVQGAAARQYAAGPDAADINEMVPGDWGVVVLEGGAQLDEFSKAFLLAWAAYHFYMDAVIQRLRRARSRGWEVQLFFEEANKMLGGLDGKSEEGGPSTAEQFEAMWRDSRKYGIALHVITQSPSQIPQGILSSCNNMVVSQTKNPKDRDLAVAM
ncbi:MAG: serine-rich protein, partial [Chloroflexi bacterium]|nr:serine-rich protein [Chloroflexota bacterium]